MYSVLEPVKRNGRHEGACDLIVQFLYVVAIHDVIKGSKVQRLLSCSLSELLLIVYLG
jgi:hypothetical protein